MAERLHSEAGSVVIGGAPWAGQGYTASDLARARRLMPLVEAGYAGSLAEAATRYAISHPAMGTILVGFSGEAR